MDMSENWCNKCQRQLQYFENIDGVDLAELLVQVEKKVAEEVPEQQTYWKCPRD